MKVYIGPYCRWIGIYQIFYTLEKIGVSHDRCHDMAAAVDKKLPFINNALNWIHENLQHRKVQIELHPYDTWSADETLAHIILPVLKQLRATKHGSPMTDMEDVPEHMRCAPPTEENNYEDVTVHERWDWIIGEMIWAFEQRLDEDAEMQFWKEMPEIDTSKHPEDEGKSTVPIRWKKEGVCDWNARQAWHDRMSNGFRLFGKYYQGLWD